MRRYLLISLALFLPGLAHAQWQLMPETSLIDLYAVTDEPFHVETRISGSSALSWPNGNQALVTLVEVIRDGEKRLHRCIEYYTPEMQSSGSSCYVLVPDE